MFGFDSQEKELKTAMQTAGADISVVKEWLKTAEKVKKQYVNTKDFYEKSRASLLRVTEILETLEKIMVSESSTREQEAKLEPFFKELKKLRGNCDHEFLISTQDREFHLTYDTIIKLGQDYLMSKADGIILQSEIENLMFLAKEAIQKEKPDMIMLSYFYVSRNDKDICELPHHDRIGKLQRVFLSEFLGTITKVLISCIEYAEKYHGDSKTLSKMSILLDVEKGREINDRAKNILKEFYVVNPETGGLKHG